MVAVVVAAGRVETGLPETEAGSVVNWFGIRGVFSTLTRGTLPTVDGEPVPFDVWLAPSMAPWTYQPTDRDGPFRLIRINFDTEAIYGYLESAAFAGVVTDFAVQHMPRREQACYILDRHCNIVIGWGWNGDGFEWVGCEYAFTVLAFHHPVDAAVWELQAYRHHRDDDINLEEWL